MMTMKNLDTAALLMLLLFCSVLTCPCDALSIDTTVSSRRQWLSNQGARSVASVGAIFVSSSIITTSSSPSLADVITTTNKLTNLSTADFTKILENDITQNQFLVTGKITREIYDESCTFQDEIDVYGMDQWIVGTSRLFNGDGSTLRLVGPIHVTSEQATFQFDEDLMFRIPLLQPVVHLTGTLYLTRDPNTGLITSYREKWDQGVWQVLASAKL